MLKKVIILTLLLTSIIGCTPKIANYKAYDGEQLPADKVSKFVFPASLLVADMNGKSYEPYFVDTKVHKGTVIEVKPGTYEFKIKYWTHLMKSTGTIPLKITAQASKTYNIEPVFADNRVSLSVK